MITFVLNACCPCFCEEGAFQEIMPWDAPPGKSCVHRYSRGNAVVFDGKLPHRTQPFAAETFAQRDRGLVAWRPAVCRIVRNSPFIRAEAVSHGSSLS